jgi:hypothetical protein
MWREARLEVTINVKKHLRFRALFAVELSKKCIRLWREADFQSSTFFNNHGEGRKDKGDGGGPTVFEREGEGQGE